MSERRRYRPRLSLITALVLVVAALAVVDCGKDEPTSPAVRWSDEKPGYVELLPGDRVGWPTIVRDTYLPPGNSYAFQHVHIQEGTTLLIGEGCHLRLSSFDIRGSLVVDGAENDAVVMSPRYDAINIVASDGATVRMEYCIVDSLGSLEASGGDLEISKCSFRDICSIELEGSRIESHDTTYRFLEICRQYNNRRPPVHLKHCGFGFEDCDFDLRQIRYSDYEDKHGLMVDGASHGSITGCQVFEAGARLVGPSRVDIRDSVFQNGRLHLREVPYGGIHGCVMQGEGAGLYASLCGDLICSDTTFDSTQTAISVNRGEMRVLRCWLRGCRNFVSTSNGTVSISNSLFERRFAEGYSESGIRISKAEWQEDAELVNCVISGHMLVSGKLNIRNSILWGGIEGAGPLVHSSVRFYYCDLDSLRLGEAAENEAEMIDCFSACPRFLMDGSPYELAGDSPCRDRGDWRTMYDDLDGTRNDLGIYGGPLADGP